jgi:dGTPase
MRQSKGLDIASDMPRTDAARSRGRLVSETACPMRTPFQRDRDRIVHATAFRRLTHKTQVFLYHEGDHYRTRLTHTLEVAQIARAISRLLSLDEDLAEALALAHDLGHPPFGHAGERALDAVLDDYGGFDHNAQSLKVVIKLERKYMTFDGLNLTFETLEGLAKHNGPIHAGPIKDVLDRAGLTPRLALATEASLEAQAAAIADDIAYNNHDIDDGLRAGLLTLDDLATVPLAGPFVRAALAATNDRPRVIYEVNRRMITAMIADVVAHARTEAAAGADPLTTPFVTFSPAMAADLRGLKSYLFERVYRHPRVMRVMGDAEQIVRDLTLRYLDSPLTIPSPRSADIAQMAHRDRAGPVLDFVAGMTDRYAIAEHQRLFDATPELR